MSADLSIELRPGPTPARAGEPISLLASYANLGSAPLALTFWWNRSMRVLDAQGQPVAPGPGPVLPCGSGEDWLVLQPGERHERAEPLSCTQPAGRSEPIGWSYPLGPGTYRVTLIFQAPPEHGFSQSSPEPRAFSGRVESGELTLVVGPAAPRGLLDRLLGRRAG